MSISTSIKYKDIFNQVAGSLNALAAPILGPATTTNQVSTDPAYSEYEIMECILGAEYELARAICTTSANGRKLLYESGSSPFTTTDNPSNIPSHLGQIIDVQIKRESADTKYFLGEPISASIISRLAQGINPLGLTLHKGLYSLVDNTLWFTGNTARVRFCEYTRPNLPTDAATLATLLNTLANTPDDYLFAVAVIAIAKILPKEGSLTGAGAYYMQLAQSEIQGILDGRPPITDWQMFQSKDK